jgi:hypothetical protein
MKLSLEFEAQGQAGPGVNESAKPNDILPTKASHRGPLIQVPLPRYI